MVRLTGGTTGVKTIRDWVLLALGAFIDVFHMVTVSSGDYRLDILLFGAGLMGSPYVLKADEKKKE